MDPEIRKGTLGDGRAARRRAGLNEMVLRQHGGQFVLFAALDPETRKLIHLRVTPSRNYLTTRRFLDEIESLYSALPEVVLTDDASGYGAAFSQLRIRHVVLAHGVRNRVERWIQELKRRIDTFYASFTGKESIRLNVGSANSPGFGTTA